MNTRIERPGPRTALLVSPPFACGVAYLGNILLSLDIKVEPPGQPENGGYWTRMPDGSHEIAGAALDHYRTHFHLLETRRNFRFDPSWTAVMEHEFGMADELHDAVILFVRDPIDSLYSWHRRYVGGEHDFRDYLDRTVMPANHMPVVLGARPLLIYALFAAYWLAGRRKPTLVVRFEDIKQRPVEVVGGILDFLGLQRDEGRIRDSVAASDVGGLIKAHAGDPTFKMARRGMAGEWREHMSMEEWSRLTSAEPVRSVCAMLGYGPPDGGRADLLTPPDPAFSDFVHALLDHMEEAVRASGAGTVAQAEALVPAAAADALRCVDFRLAGGVMACGGLAADSRLLDGYRAAASAMILLLNGCRYFAPERGDAAVVFSNAGFHERFIALASLLYQTQDQVDVLRMVAGLMPSIRSMGNQYEWGKIVGAPVDIGRSWPGIDDLLGIKPRTF